MFCQDTSRCFCHPCILQCINSHIHPLHKNKQISLFYLNISTCSSVLIITYVRTWSKVSLNLNLCLLRRHQASYSQGFPCKAHTCTKFRAEFDRIPSTVIILPESGRSRRQARKPNSLLLPMTLQHLNYLLPHHFLLLSHLSCLMISLVLCAASWNCNSNIHI